MPMLLLIKDHLRRNWKSLTLMSLIFAFFSSSMVLDASSTFSLARTSPWIIYVYYSFLASRIGMNSDLNVLRFSRTLPFRESTLANLIWSMAVVAPPVFAFLIVLLLGCLGIYFGKAHPFTIAWPLLFLLLATLLSGVLTFVSIGIPRIDGPAMAKQNMQKGDRLSASYIARLLFAVACAVTAFVLLFYPTPTRWLDLTPRHLAGMGLAAYLTWKSYQLRYWRLQSDLPQKAIAHRAPKKEIAPLHYGSPLAAVAQDLKAIVRGSLIMILGCIGLGYLVQFCLTWSGLAPQGSDLYQIFTPTITILAVLLAAMLIFTQFGRISVLGAVRALPLTGNQCVLLFLSYPFAVTLAVVPCITAHLWLKGYGHPSTLLLGGILFSAGLCPFAMLIAARFGSRGLIWMAMVASMGVGISSSVAILYNLPSTPLSSPLQSNGQSTLLSMPILCAGVLVLAVLGVGGYCGLLYLVENSSAVYKRKMSPQQFGQR